MYRVLIIAEFDKFGGTRSYYKRLVEYYVRNGYKVDIAIKKNQLDNDIKGHLEQLNICPKRLMSVGPLIRGLLRRFKILEILRALNIIYIAVSKRADFIAVSVGTPGLYYATLFTHLRVLYILHTYPGGMCKKGEAKSKITQLKRMVRSIPIGPRRRILTVSKYARVEIVEGWMCQRVKPFIHIVLNTVGDVIPINSNQGLNHCDMITVLTLGHVTYYKNPKMWVKVVQGVIDCFGDKNIQFIWCGDGDELEIYRELVAELGLSSNVEFVGLVRSVDHWFELADIYFQPSLIENHSLSVIDAMRHSIPCVVSNVGGLPESVVDKETGYVLDPSDDMGFVQAILSLILDKTLCVKLGNKGRDRYENMFGLAIWEEQMDSLHMELLNS